MKNETKPEKFILLCARKLTERLPLVCGIHGHPVTIVRDSEACVTISAPEPCMHARKALEGRICDRHNLPIIEVTHLPAQVPVARPT